MLDRMKVLILYPTENQASLIKGCVDNLHFKGIKTFALNKNTWDYYTLDSAEFRTVINHLERWLPNYAFSNCSKNCVPLILSSI